jgi:hypothetical protein
MPISAPADIHFIICAFEDKNLKKRYKLKDLSIYPFLIHKHCNVYLKFHCQVPDARVWTHAYTHTSTQTWHNFVLCIYVWILCRQKLFSVRFFIPVLFIFPSHRKLYNFGIEVVSLSNPCMQDWGAGHPGICMGHQPVRSTKTSLE